MARDSAIERAMVGAKWRNYIISISLLLPVIATIIPFILGHDNFIGSWLPRSLGLTETRRSWSPMVPILGLLTTAPFIALGILAEKRIVNSWHKSTVAILPITGVGCALVIVHGFFLISGATLSLYDTRPLGPDEKDFWMVAPLLLAVADGVLGGAGWMIGLIVGRLLEPRTIVSLSEAAQEGDTHAMMVLASKYEAGEGTKVDLVQSFHWYSKAAEIGLSKAQLRLGLAYQKGHGVQKDELEALKWYIVAWKNGEAQSRFYVEDLNAKLDKSKVEAAQLAAVEYLSVRLP